MHNGNRCPKGGPKRRWARELERQDWSTGLGMGFGSLAAKTGESERAVSLSPPVVTGFLFIALNSITILTAGLFVGKGKIPVSYGWVALTLYIIYLVTSISLSYSNKDDGNG